MRCHGSYMSLFDTWWLYVSLWCMHVGVSYSNVWFRTNERFIGQAWLCSCWPVTAAKFCLFNQTICYIVCVVTEYLSWVVLTNEERTLSWECSSILWGLFVSFPGLCTMDQALYTCMPFIECFLLPQEVCSHCLYWEWLEVRSVGVPKYTLLLQHCYNMNILSLGTELSCRVNGHNS